MKEKIKKNWWIVLIILVFVILVVSYFLFVLDIEINSKYFIKRDFNSAFLARQTGNCNLFKEYVSEQYREIWGVRCIHEKDRYETLPVKNFRIKNITIDKNTAFLQVELEREEKPYVVNYDMQKNNFGKFLYIFPETKWIIMNEIK